MDELNTDSEKLLFFENYLVIKKLYSPLFRKNNIVIRYDKIDSIEIIDHYYFALLIFTLIDLILLLVSFFYMKELVILFLVFFVGLLLLFILYRQKSIVINTFKQKILLEPNNDLEKKLIEKINFKN